MSGPLPSGHPQPPGRPQPSLHPQPSVHPQRSTYPLPSTYPTGQPGLPGEPPPPTYPPDVLIMDPRSPGPARRSRRRWVAGIGLMVVLAIGAGVASVALHGSNTTNTPRAAVEGWLAAAAAGDTDEARSFTCAALANYVEQDMRGLVGTTWQITSAEQIDDTTATVTLALTRQVDQGSQLVTTRWRVVREGNAWKVCDYGEM